MTSSRVSGVIAAALLSFVTVTDGAAADLFRGDGWSNLAADRVASRVGDSLTVIIYENSLASSSTGNRSRKTSRLKGALRANSSSQRSGDISLDGAFEAVGGTERTGKLVAQITVVVDSVLPNGDLHLHGEQDVKVNGEHTRIRIEGRIRPTDISGTNTVLSTRLAEAHIEYMGSGFVSRGARPGLLTRFSNWVGVP